MKTHTDEAKVDCSLCKIVCSNESNLKKHNKLYAYEHKCISNGNCRLSFFYHIVD